MKIPNNQLAVVPREKILGYLLSLTHRIGHDKAVFFMRFGFTVEGWEDLAVALKRHAEQHNVVVVEPTTFGVRYVVEGPINTPSARQPWIRVVWFVDADGTIPRIVTAYPLEEPNSD